MKVGNCVLIGPISNLKEGDRIVLHWRVGKGIQSETPKYK